MDTEAKVPELKAINSDAGENNLDSSAIPKVEWEFGWLPLEKKDPVLKELLEDEERHLEEMLLKNPQKVIAEKLERVKEGLGYFG